MKHRNLFILEIAPVEVGKSYNELPSHLTLMSRFFSKLSPEQLAEIVHPLFEKTKPANISFGEPTRLGPRRLIVHMVEYSDQLKRLYNELRALLASINVEYEYPQFIGENHKPHVPQRKSTQFNASERFTGEAICLVEVVDGKRAIRARFTLTGYPR
jgi:hypothetical protein